MKITGNESVSRVIDKEDNGYGVMLTYIESKGLTIRQHFAAMAMQGFLASCEGDSVPDRAVVARHSIRYADALIKELNETPNPNE